MENKTKFSPKNLLAERQGQVTKYILSAYKKKFENETLLSIKYLKCNFTVIEQYEYVTYIITTSNLAVCLLLDIPENQGEDIADQLIRSGKFKKSSGRCPVKGKLTRMIEFLNL